MSPVVLLQDWILYRELVGLIFENKLSTGDQRAEDIMSSVMAMKNLSPVDNSYLYPVLAHYAEKGDVEGVLARNDCCMIDRFSAGNLKLLYIYSLCQVAWIFWI